MFASMLAFLQAKTTTQEGRTNTRVLALRVLYAVFK
jgi:hypothetical protein